MTKFSAEFHTECLGWFAQSTVELEPEAPRYCVPNIGWHTIDKRYEDDLFDGIDAAKEPFYFCHKYCVPSSNRSYEVATLAYSQTISTVLKSENILGVQFHPEKSFEAGLRLIYNFFS